MAYAPASGLYGAYQPPQSQLSGYQQLQHGGVTGYLEPTRVSAGPGGVAGPSGAPVAAVANQQYGVYGVQSLSSNIIHPGSQAHVNGQMVSYDAERDAKDLHKAMTGAGTDDKTLMRILCHRPRDHIEKIKYFYERRYKASLYRNIQHDTSFNYKETLLSLLQPFEEVKARHLHRAVDGPGTKDKSLIDVLAYSSNDELRKIKWEYQVYFGKDGDLNDALARDIKDDTSGNFERALITLLKAERDESFLINEEKVKHDAKTLYEKGEKRWGTDDSYFIEFFCMRSPWHIAAVNEEYKKAHGHDLAHAINNETSGDFKDLLLALVTPKAYWYAERLEYSMKGIGTRDWLLIFLLTSTTEVERLVIRQKYEELYKKTLKDRIKGDTSGDYMNALLHLITFGSEIDEFDKKKS